MTLVIIILALGLVISLAFNMGFFSPQAPANAPGAADNRPALKDETVQARVARTESELEKKRKDYEELKRSQGDLKDELKAAKKKLFDLGQSDKDGDNLARARAEVERQASTQLDVTRGELANALIEVQKLKTELEAGKGKRRERVEAPVAEKAADAPPPQRVIRELSDAEKEKMARLEAQSGTDRQKAQELGREIRSVKAKIEKMNRDFKHAHNEAQLSKDKFHAVERRLNRTLLENDLLRRAIADVEKKTGIAAGRVALTTEEIAQSDKSLADRHAADDKAEAEARARLEAAEATQLAAAEAAEAAPAAGEAAPAAAPTAVEVAAAPREEPASPAPESAPAPAPSPTV